MKLIISIKEIVKQFVKLWIHVIVNVRWVKCTCQTRMQDIHWSRGCVFRVINNSLIFLPDHHHPARVLLSCPQNRILAPFQHLKLQWMNKWMIHNTTTSYNIMWIQQCYGHNLKISHGEIWDAFHKECQCS